MTDLLVFKDKIKDFYGRYSVIIDYAFKFVMALSGLLLVRSMCGDGGTLSKTLVIVILAFICMLLPKCVTLFMMCATMLANMFSASPEYAILAFVAVFILFVAYFVFSPEHSYALILTLMLMFIKLPYVLPVVLGLMSGVAGIVPMVFGIYLYYVMGFMGDFVIASKNFTEGDFIQKITFMVDNTILDKNMIVIMVVFSASLLLVGIIKGLSVNYSWVVAIVTGAVVNIILVIMSHTMLSLDYSMAGLFMGSLVGVLIGLAVYFFVLSVDYSGTEHVTFEDDDYLYYVKAVPKMSVTKAQPTTKKINARREENPQPVSHDAGEYGMTDEEELEKRQAYEQDILDLEEEE